MPVFGGKARIARSSRKEKRWLNRQIIRVRTKRVSVPGPHRPEGDSTASIEQKIGFHNSNDGFESFFELCTTEVRFNFKNQFRKTTGKKILHYHEPEKKRADSNHAHA